MSNVLDLLRPDLRDFTLYHPADSAADAIRLHANELPWRPDGDDGERGLNRYPQPRPDALRARLARLYGVTDDQLLLTRGSDDGIDLLVRSFCRAGVDRVTVTTPCFAMYAACARLQGCAVDDYALKSDSGFAFDASALLEATGDATRLVFLCSPNNPTGAALDAATIADICGALRNQAIVVVDEAYAEFSALPSTSTLLAGQPNLVVLRTLSKAWGLAGLRIGSLVGNADVIGILNRLYTPYPLPSACVDVALAATSDAHLERQRQRWDRIVAERELLRTALDALPGITRVWPSDGNFLLARFADASAAADAARRGGVLVRALGGPLADCLRVSVGAPDENRQLLAAWQGLAA